MESRGTDVPAIIERIRYERFAQILSYLPPLYPVAMRHEPFSCPSEFTRDAASRRGFFIRGFCRISCSDRPIYRAGICIPCAVQGCIRG